MTPNVNKHTYCEGTCQDFPEMRGYHIRISIKRQPESSKQAHSADVFVPTHLFHQFPAHKPKPTSRRNALFNPANKDYRFGPIRLDWVDFELASKAPHTTMGKEREQGRGSFFGYCLSPFVFTLRRSYLCSSHALEIWVYKPSRRRGPCL
jgi:hypothetical protein